MENTAIKVGDGVTFEGSTGTFEVIAIGDVGGVHNSDTRMVVRQHCGVGVLGEYLRVKNGMRLYKQSDRDQP